jgi:hypothetical protein
VLTTQRESSAKQAGQESTLLGYLLSQRIHPPRLMDPVITHSIIACVRTPALVSTLIGFFYT